MKNIKNIGFVLIALGLLFSIAYYIKTNSRSAITYETEQLKYKTIEDKIVATGSVVPEDEVNIVPQISGIIQEIFVDEGDQVTSVRRYTSLVLAGKGGRDRRQIIRHSTTAATAPPCTTTASNWTRAPSSTPFSKPRASTRRRQSTRESPESASPRRRRTP